MKLPPVVLAAAQAAREDLAYRTGASEEGIVVCQISPVGQDPVEVLTGARPLTDEQRYNIVLDAISREYEYTYEPDGKVVYRGRRLQG